MGFTYEELRTIENALHNEILTHIALNGAPDDMIPYAKAKLTRLEQLRHKVIEQQNLLLA